ncbi:MAG: GlsB/YeaQ/YmgE family stress response membrane protein [Sphingomonas sp.]|uniref:GlsB/YeaQ/YmgE family stress response membrane protein n=1 Tax=Sphingomonas sp. TaxID=28214 RepID=UPI001AC9FDF6|nr:GlsB/YeaQ/YmgE family stress response membrane protein [Sphingomonas sp.]MBN8808622.1 GlsB/YeaQ/YmgE family stress response membrane protein [Sphingomonas sp.]
MLGILRMIVVGFIVGVLARFLYPGHIPLSFLWTVILGIAGSFLAGLVGMALHPAERTQGLHPAGFLASIVGAMVLIFIAIRLHWFGA